MATRALNFRMDEKEMLDLKKVASVFNISMTDLMDYIEYGEIRVENILWRKRKPLAPANGFVVSYGKTNTI